MVIFIMVSVIFGLIATIAGAAVFWDLLSPIEGLVVCVVSFGVILWDIFRNKK